MCAVPGMSMISDIQHDIENGYEYGAYLTFFTTLTAKQHEVFALVAEGRSSKEIAWRLGISDSAVNQRVEAVRSRAGSPTRAELGRAYRFYLASLASSRRSGDAMVSTAGAPPFHAIGGCEQGSSPLFSALQSGHGEVGAQHMPAGLIVPKAFTGPSATLNRFVAMVVLAAGLLIVAMVALSVVQALAEML
jgi:DNA-binding CsgD family transcriptional regulator